MRGTPAPRRIRGPIVALALALLLGPAACGGMSGSGSSTGGSSTLLVRADLDPVDNLSVLEAIERLRPRWLRGRPGADDPVVFLDNAQIGGIEQLGAIPVGNVEQIRYRNGRDATTRYGTGFGGGAIEITSRGDG